MKDCIEIEFNSRNGYVTYGEMLAGGIGRSCAACELLDIWYANPATVVLLVRFSRNEEAALAGRRAMVRIPLDRSLSLLAQLLWVSVERPRVEAAKAEFYIESTLMNEKRAGELEARIRTRSCLRPSRTYCPPVDDKNRVFASEHAAQTVAAVARAFGFED